MDKSDDGRLKYEMTDASSIIAFMDNAPELSNDEWVEIGFALEAWFDDPTVSNEEKERVRFSGYMEMMGIIMQNHSEALKAR